jgi:gliding motility-associated-like protein
VLQTEADVNYTIYKGAVIYGDAVAGDGQKKVLANLNEVGEYTVKAESKGSFCKADMPGSFIVEPMKTPATYELESDTVCEGTAATVEIKLLDSEAGIDYTLSFEGIETSVLPGTGGPLSFSIDAKASSNGQYTITASNTQTGCSIEMPTKATILVQSGINEPKLEGSTVYCNKGTSQINATMVNGETVNWTISPATSGTIDNTGLITWNNTYIGDVTVALKVSTTACGGIEKTATFDTKVTTLPTIDLIKGDDIACRGNIKQYEVSPISPGMTYGWDTPSGVTIKEKNDGLGTAMLEFSADIPTEGIGIKVSPTSEQCGVGASVSKLVKKGDNCDLFVPNILTPGSADKNSVWVIEGVSNFPNLNIEIFNRWGSKVYANTGMYTKPWDGTHNGQPLPTATYYYVIDRADGTDKITGSVTVVRD